jgi:hypothetical protein
MKICQKIHILVTIGPKYWARYGKMSVSCMVAGDINSPQKHCCATLSIFILLTVTRSSTMLIERIVTFPLQQTLNENATLLRHTESSPYNRPRMPRGGVEV